jgi:hypothetical protein
MGKVLALERIADELICVLMYEDEEITLLDDMLIVQEGELMPRSELVEVNNKVLVADEKLVSVLVANSEEETRLLEESTLLEDRRLLELDSKALFSAEELVIVLVDDREKDTELLEQIVQLEPDSRVLVPEEETKLDEENTKLPEDVELVKASIMLDEAMVLELDSMTLLVDNEFVGLFAKDEDNDDIKLLEDDTLRKLEDNTEDIDDETELFDELVIYRGSQYVTVITVAVDVGLTETKATVIEVSVTSRLVDVALVRTNAELGDGVGVGVNIGGAVLHLVVYRQEQAELTLIDIAVGLAVHVET